MVQSHARRADDNCCALPDSCCNSRCFTSGLGRESLCSNEEAEHEYGLSLTNEYKQNYYDAVVVAVGHNEFKDMGAKQIRALGKAEHILYDLKYVLPKESVDMRL